MQLYDHRTAPKSINTPIRVESLDKSDKVRVNVQVSRGGTLAGLSSGRMRRLEEIGLVKEFGTVKS